MLSLKGELFLLEHLLLKTLVLHHPIDQDLDGRMLMRFILVLDLMTMSDQLAKQFIGTAKLHFILNLQVVTHFQIILVLMIGIIFILTIQL